MIPPVNLIRNCGFGDDATHTVEADNLGGAVPRGVAPAVDATRPRPAPDPDYDRRSLLLEIMASYREPAMVARLARSRRLLVDADGTSDPYFQYHLAPFDQLDESIEAVRHLRAAGMEAEFLDRLEGAFVTARDRRTGS